jgi:glyoxylase-like metal-dependent hydrolase (beta-lactamase superfamily II)
MKTTQHGPNLWQLTRLWAFNCYLVKEEDGLTLIDTGLSGSTGQILAAAAAIGLPLTRIALTHAHADHAGSLAQLAAERPQATVAMSSRTAAFLQGQRSLQSHEPQTKLRGSFINCDTHPTHTLSDGDYVGSLRVLAAPGHTPDQIAFFDERDQTLIGGDAFQTQAGVAVAGVMRWRFPFPALATWHLPTALASAQTLHALQPARLAVGHGPVLEQPQPQMAQAIEAAKARVHG